jgi:hypothetical protein
LQTKCKPCARHLPGKCNINANIMQHKCKHKCNINANKMQTQMQQKCKHKCNTNANINAQHMQHQSTTYAQQQPTLATAPLRNMGPPQLRCWRRPRSGLGDPKPGTAKASILDVRYIGTAKPMCVAF